MNDRLYKNITLKSSQHFASDLKKIADQKGFMIANESKMNMADTFSYHGVDVSKDFDLQMIQICKPDKAAPSLQHNPERAVLMPKFVMAFSDGEKTQIRFHHYSQEVITEMVENDESFPASLAGTYKQIISMIEEAI